MLNENIKAIRKAKGLSQQELAVKVNVVRQTVSKWEQGLSVPDADMLLALSEALETPVSVLLGKTVVEPEADTLQAISQKLEVINLQLAAGKPPEGRWSAGCSFRSAPCWHCCSLPSCWWAAPIWRGITATQKPPSLAWPFTPWNGCLSGWRRLSFWLRWLGFSSPIRKSERSFSMKKKIFAGIFALAAVLALVCILSAQGGSGAYVPAADEIACASNSTQRRTWDCWCTTTAQKTATTAGASPTRTARCFRATRKTWWCGTGRAGKHR